MAKENKKAVTDENSDSQDTESTGAQNYSNDHHLLPMLAGMAMQGILAKQGTTGPSSQWVAEKSVELAKVLIAELEKDPEEDYNEAATA